MQCWLDSHKAHALSLIQSPGGFIKLLWRSTLHHHYHHHSSCSSSSDNNNNIIMSSQQNPAEPPNFSWVEPRKLAGLARPTMVHHYRYLLDNGVKHLVSLLEIKPPNYEKCPELILHQISIVDFTPPSLSQILQFLSIVEKANAKGEGVAVHCAHGHGRTGTMLACYLVKSRHLTGEEAIKEIRRLREGSVETKEQEQAVIDFHKYIHSGCQKH